MNLFFYNDLFFDGFKHQIKLSEEHNGWFSEKNILFALESWAKLLTTEKLTNWITNYPIETVLKKDCHNHGREYSYGWVS